MKIRIDNGAPKQMRLINEDGALVGLISETSDNCFRVEMFSKYDVKHFSKDRAIGFAYGVAAATPGKAPHG